MHKGHMRNILELREEEVNILATEFGFASGGATFTVWGTLLKTKKAGVDFLFFYIKFFVTK